MVLTLQRAIYSSQKDFLPCKISASVPQVKKTHGYGLIFDICNLYCYKKIFPNYP